MLSKRAKRAKMAAWAAIVERIVGKPPGSDEGFSPESIERHGRVSFARFSTWTIICEEVLDTQFSRAYFERAREELHRRRISDSEIAELRRFAWLTAGWLNFECGLWEWCNLDEHDIYLAIERQHAEGLISAAERDRRVEFAKRYDGAAGAGGSPRAGQQTAEKPARAAILRLLRQLPDIDGQELVFEWDQEGERYSVVRYGDRVVWREETGWEVYDSFERVATALRYKYGPRLKDLVPTRGSLDALLGDSTRANFVVADARQALGRAPGQRGHTPREMAGAIREGDIETVYCYLARGGNPTWFSGDADIGLLHLAVRGRQSLVVWMLLNAGAQVDAPDGDGRSALAVALEESARHGGDDISEIVGLLAEAGADPGRTDRT